MDELVREMDVYMGSKTPTDAGGHHSQPLENLQQNVPSEKMNERLDKLVVVDGGDNHNDEGLVAEENGLETQHQQQVEHDGDQMELEQNVVDHSFETNGRHDVDNRSGKSSSKMRGLMASQISSMGLFPTMRKNDSELEPESEDTRKVFMEIMGSRPINFFLVILFLVWLTCLIYTFIVAGTSLGFCDYSVNSVSRNPWYKLMVPSPSPLRDAQIGVGMYFLKDMLQTHARIQNKPFYSDVPMCAFCENETLQDLFVDWNKVENRSLWSSDFLKNNSFWLDTSLWGNYIPQVFLFGDLFEHVPAVVCQTNFLTPLLAFMLDTTVYQDAALFSGNVTEVPNMVSCLLNGNSSQSYDVDDPCFPCGDPLLMDVNVEPVNQSFGYLVDKLSGTRFTTDEAGRLYGRCVAVMGDMALSPCQVGTSNHPKAKIWPDVDETFRSMFPYLPDTPTAGPKYFIKARQSNGTTISSGEFSPGNLGIVFQLIRQSIVYGGPIFHKLKSECSSQGKMDSILRLIQQDASPNPDDWFDWGLCWFMYASFYHGTPGCFDHVLQRNRPDNVDPTNEIDTLAFVYFDYMTTATTHLENGTLQEHSHGLPVMSMYNALAAPERPSPMFGPNTSFPMSFSDFRSGTKECINKLNSAPEELNGFIDFFNSFKLCKSPAGQYLAGVKFDSACWIIACIVLFGEFLWLFFDGKTGFSLPLFALLISTCFFCDPRWLFIGTSWTEEQVLEGRFFVPRDIDRPVVKYFDICEPVLAFGFFYLFHSYFLRQVGKDESGLSDIRWFKPVVIASLYVAIRLTILLVTNTSPGLVPFVNIITLGRICMIEGVVPAPYCMSPDMQGQIGVGPFVANILVVFLDIALFIIAHKDTSYCLGRIKVLPYSKTRFVAYRLKTILTQMLFWILFITGIVYTSVISLGIGYDGYFSFEDDKVFVKGVSLLRTGVQDWAIGFTLAFVAFTFSWALFLVPVNTWIGKRFSDDAPVSAKRIVFYSRMDTTERKVREGKCKGIDEAEEIASVFAHNLFVLESHFINMAMQFTSYSFDEDAVMKHLPPPYRLLKFIHDEITDTNLIIIASLSAADPEVIERIYISFRGTASAKNAKTDAKMSLTPLKWVWDKNKSITDSLKASSESSTESLDSSVSSPYLARAQSHLDRYEELASGRVKVHFGFLEAFATVQDEIVETLGTVLQSDQALKDMQYYVSGHSLGGGLATICALMLTQAFETSNVQLSTCGSPRVGNVEFRILFGQNVPSCFRFCMQGDPIPKGPPTLWGYNHVGVLCMLDHVGNLTIDPSLLEYSVMHRCKSGGSGEHKTGAYLASLLAFTVNYTNSYNPVLWPNLISAIRRHVTADFPKESPLRERLEAYIDSFDIPVEEEEIKTEKSQQEKEEQQILATV